MTPNKQRFDYRAERNRGDESDRDAAPCHGDAPAEDHADDLPAGGADRHPHADLLRALRDRAGEHAVKPDRRQEQRDAGERTAQE